MSMASPAVTATYTYRSMFLLTRVPYRSDIESRLTRLRQHQCGIQTPARNFHDCFTLKLGIRYKFSLLKDCYAVLQNEIHADIFFLEIPMFRGNN